MKKKREQSKLEDQLKKKACGTANYKYTDSEDKDMERHRERRGRIGSWTAVEEGDGASRGWWWW